MKDNLIGVIRINNKDYISLTDLARYKNEYNSGDVIIKWMINKSSFDFYCLWEELFNEVFANDKSVAGMEKYENNRRLIEAGKQRN